MSTISVKLPDSVLSAISERAQKSGYMDVSEFVSQMLVRINDRQSQVEAFAIEGLESGPSEPWNGAEIESIRNELRAKHGS